MPNDLTTNRAIATRSSNVSTELASLIPSWVDRGALHGSLPYGYAGTIPPGQASALREAAASHHLAMQPATAEERQSVLRGLRSATILQREDADEAEATMKMLRVHLSEVPLDILEAACRAYCNVPGRRFFPRSAGELRAFVNPLLAERAGLAYRLRRLADQAEAEDAERERLAADPLTAEAIAAIKAEFGLDRLPAPARPAPRRIVGTPTVDDYRALGLTEAEAAQAVCDHARILARGVGDGMRAATAAALAPIEEAIAAE